MKGLDKVMQSMDLEKVLYYMCTVYSTSYVTYHNTHPIQSYTSPHNAHGYTYMHNTHTCTYILHTYHPHIHNTHTIHTYYTHTHHTHHTHTYYTHTIHTLHTYTQIGATMEKFEGLFEDLDVHTQVLDSTMSAATTLNTPDDQVESLMKQVAEQNGLEVLDQLAEHPVSQQTPTSGVPTLSTQEQDQLSKRYFILFYFCAMKIFASSTLGWQHCGHLTRLTTQGNVFL